MNRVNEKTRIAFMGDMFSLAASLEDGLFVFEPLQTLEGGPLPSDFVLGAEDCIEGADLDYALEVISYADSSCFADYEEGHEPSREHFLFIVDECMREGLPY